MSEKQKVPDGWDEQRTREVLGHYEGQTEEVQAAEIDKAQEATLPNPEPAVTSQERAGVGLRVYVVLLGLAGIGMGLMFLFALSEVPTWCRWLMYVFAPLFVVGSALMLFLGLRGRKADLQWLTGRTTGKDAVKDDADTAATSAAAIIVGEVIDKLS